MKLQFIKFTFAKIYFSFKVEYNINIATCNLTLITDMTCLSPKDTIGKTILPGALEILQSGCDRINSPVPIHLF